MDLIIWNLLNTIVGDSKIFGEAVHVFVMDRPSLNCAMV